MATANDSIYINIIAKMQDAMSGLNSFIKTLTLGGSAFYAFRKAAQVVNAAMDELRKQNKDLDDAMKRAQTGVKDLMAGALSPWKDDIRDIANGFATLAEKITGARAAAEEYAATQERIQRQMATLAGTIEEYNLKLAETRQKAALQEYATVQVQFENQVKKYMDERNKEISEQKAGVNAEAYKRVSLLTPETAGKLVRETGYGAQLDAAKKAYEDATNELKQAQDVYDAKKGGGQGAVFSDFDANILAEIKELQGETGPLIEATFSDNDYAILEEIRALQEQDNPLIEATFSDSDYAVLEEIKALQEQDNPLIGAVFSDNDAEILKQLKELQDEDATKLQDEYKKIAGYIAEVTQSLASGDIVGALKGTAQIIWNEVVTPWCLAAAAKAAVVGNYLEAAMWIGIAGVGSGLIGAIGSGGGEASHTPEQYSQYPVYPGAGTKSLVVVNNIGGSVVTDRQIAANTAKIISEWG